MSEASPRVLLVDDHRQLLDAVSAMLTAHDFDIVATATDGFEAADAARRTNPDVIVLDVDMPGLDGFQTVRAIREAGLADTPIVFLSMHDADDIVSHAFRSGAKGYVLKRRIGRDLVSALGQALSGRFFVPSLEALFNLTGGTGHAMQLHVGLEPFLDELAGFFELALERGDATCVIATEPCRDGLMERLRRRGWESGSCNRLRVIDAATALSRVMLHGFPDRDRLAEIAAELEEYRLTTAESASSHLTVFGNMVMALREEGNAEAILPLERTWNSVTRDLPFFTLCGYATTCFHEAMPGLWPGACAEHRVLSHAADV
jgi:CheY-like chemotaxis protein